MSTIKQPGLSISTSSLTRCRDTLIALIVSSSLCLRSSRCSIQLQSLRRLLTPYLQQLVPALLFELSDRDPTRFIRNVGYGHAAGYTFSRGVQLSPEDLAAGSSGNTVGRFEYNPITGQRRNTEPRHDLPKMTEEEKEHEAEGLFVLFERSVPIPVPHFLADGLEAQTEWCGC